MAFPRRLLREGEDLVLDLRPHPIAIAFQVFVAILVVVAFILVETHLPGAKTSGIHRFVKWLTLGVGLGVLLIVCAPGIVGWLTSHFVVTSERVIHRSGWISKHQTDIPLDRVQNIAFKQSVFERMIGAGDLTLESAGEESDTSFEDVRHPEHVQKTIYVLREQDEQRRLRPVIQQPPAGAPAAPPGQASTRTESGTATTVGMGAGSSIADELSKLASLRDRGVISESEFQAQKARLLGS